MKPLVVPDLPELNAPPELISPTRAILIRGTITLVVSSLLAFLVVGAALPYGGGSGAFLLLWLAATLALAVWTLLPVVKYDSARMARTNGRR
jgi:hypothetical protein